ncbi:MAG TPA: hypothetical protein VD973_26580 [Symbiobacteriaceae bacterium]|nr:hypothetical protein [Symbiobacteriaceae bacterium]
MMPMTHPAKWLARKLPLLLLLFMLALWRAERGVAEVQGRTRAPSELLHLARDSSSEGWALTFLGRETFIAPETVQAWNETAATWRLRALEQLDRIKEALPSQ